MRRAYEIRLSHVQQRVVYFYEPITQYTAHSGSDRGMRIEQVGMTFVRFIERLRHQIGP